MNKTRVIVAGASAIAVATALVGVGTVASADDASGASKGKGGVLSQLEDDGTLTSDEMTAVKDALRAQRTSDSPTVGTPIIPLIIQRFLLLAFQA